MNDIALHILEKRAGIGLKPLNQSLGQWAGRKAKRFGNKIKNFVTGRKNKVLQKRIDSRIDRYNKKTVSNLFEADLDKKIKNNFNQQSITNNVQNDANKIISNKTNLATIGIYGGGLGLYGAYKALSGGSQQPQQPQSQQPQQPQQLQQPQQYRGY